MQPLFLHNAQGARTEELVCDGVARGIYRIVNGGSEATGEETASLLGDSAISKQPIGTVAAIL